MKALFGSLGAVTVMVLAPAFVLYSCAAGAASAGGLGGLVGMILSITAVFWVFSFILESMKR